MIHDYVKESIPEIIHHVWCLVPIPRKENCVTGSIATEHLAIKLSIRFNNLIAGHKKVSGIFV